MDRFPQFFGFLTVLALAVAALATPGAASARDSAAAAPIVIANPTSDQTTAGAVTWTARVATAVSVSFLVDGKPLRTTASRPYSVRLNTTKLANGKHRLTVQAHFAHKREASSSVTVVVANPAPSEPSGSTNPSHGSSAPRPVGGGTVQPLSEEPTGPTEITPSEPAPGPITAEPSPTNPEAPVNTLPEAPPPSASPAAPGSIYWGAWIGSQLTGGQAPWDMSAVTKFEQLTHKQVSLINFAAPFANCPTGSSTCTYYNFPVNEMNNIRGHGSIPVYSWSSQSIPSTTSEPNFQLADVIAGTYDSYIRKFAEAAKAWGHPFFLRFNWEMNGTWFPWSEGVNGNKSGEYVAAWRHVHDIFTEVGAKNVSWVWCPNVDPYHKLHDLKSLYPGDAYVDWSSLDGYNWGTNPAKPDRWLTFDQLYRSTYETIVNTIAPSKPMMIGEVGSTEDGGSKATWIKEMLEEIPTRYPKIRAVMWFEQFDDGMDWPIETSTASANAFAAGISNPAYAGNTFASLPAAPIAPSTG